MRIVFYRVSVDTAVWIGEHIGETVLMGKEKMAVSSSGSVDYLNGIPVLFDPRMELIDKRIAEALYVA